MRQSDNVGSGSQEALEARSSVEHLTEELGKLRVDLERQEALAS